MLIKSKDSSGNKILTLEKILALPSLDKSTQLKVEKELKIFKSGERGEETSAYFIDFHYKESKNWVIIHDLRIKSGNNIAQIDHLLINRYLEFYILETKNYANGIKINELGEFMVWVGKTYKGIESPIEQNKRHIAVLHKLITEENLLPKKLGFSIAPKFKPYILVSPTSRVDRPKQKEFDTSMIIKADQLKKTLDEYLDTMGITTMVTSLGKLVSVETLKELAEKIVSYHQPIEVDYYSKFGLDKNKFQEKIHDVLSTSGTSGARKVDSPQVKLNIQADDYPKASPVKQSYTKYFCCDCKTPISKKAAMFCFSSKGKFGGKAYCFDCQKKF